MELPASIAVGWRPRVEPLTPRAVAARGEAARALARRLLAREDEELAALDGVAGDGVIVVLGVEISLPWSDGALYLGVDPAAPALLVPCNRTPDVPVGLLESVLIHRKLPPPLAVLVDPSALVSTAAARPFRREPLTRWLGST